MKKEIIVCNDLNEISLRAAELFTRLANESIASSGRFTVALAGGSTPKALYSLLASDSYRSSILWSRVYLFWGDERCVPPDHSDSNYRMVSESMLQKVPLPAENIFRIRAELHEPDEAASEYEQIIQRFFKISEGEWPRFDLVLLGMGDDGHTASLFPQTTALNVTDKLVVANYVKKFKSSRITFTAPVINHAVNVVFMIAGDNKAEPLKEVLEGEHVPERFPSQLVHPENGNLIFLVDRAAARLINQK